MIDLSKTTFAFDDADRDAAKRSGNLILIRLRSSCKSNRALIRLYDCILWGSWRRIIDPAGQNWNQSKSDCGFWGPRIKAGFIVWSGHTDVVPADETEWK